MQTKISCLTLQYRIMSVQLREKKPQIWMEEFGIVLYLKCKGTAAVTKHWFIAEF